MQLILTPDGQLVYLWRGDPQIANLYTLQAMRMVTQFGNTLSEWRKSRSQMMPFPGSGVLDTGRQVSMSVTQQPVSGSPGALSNGDGSHALGLPLWVFYI